MGRGVLAGMFVLLIAAPASAGWDLEIAISKACFETDLILETARSETVRIWSAAGVRVHWTTTADLPYRSRALDWLVVQCVPGDSGILPTYASRGLPIAAIRFVNSRPTNTIAVSLANARLLMDRDAIESRILAERFKVLKDLRLGRMLGRAIAHEIGHFLSASGNHTPSGLMRAVHPVGDLIGESVYPFRVERDFFLQRADGVLSGLVSDNANAAEFSAARSCLGASAGVRVC